MLIRIHYFDRPMQYVRDNWKNIEDAMLWAMAQDKFLMAEVIE